MEPKNVLVIMADQLTTHVVGCYGNPVVRTPNIDGLAAGGTRFAHASTTTPICVPARASFATGRYAHQIGAWDNAKPYTGLEAASWGHRLTAQGCGVTTVGKLHYRGVDDPTGFPDQRLPMHVLDGVGDVFGLLRGEMPIKWAARQEILEAGPGDSEYTRYDRATAAESARFLREEAPHRDAPWALFVSLVTPHHPLTVPAEYFRLYPLDSLPWPVEGSPAEWPHHPAHEVHRRLAGLAEPFDERTLRTALAAYYGLVSFVDERVGQVLEALDAANLRRDTRILFLSDHGDLLGDHGLWHKCSMYEGSVGIPMIVGGADVPVGAVAETNASLIDAFPTIVEGVGAELAPEDHDLPGRSLWGLARGERERRTVFSEYHTVYAPSAMYMVRDDRYKYVHYLDFPPELFDLVADPDERRNLADEGSHGDVIDRLERELRGIVADPVGIDQRAKADQRARLLAAGGPAAVAARGPRFAFTPAPPAFDPAPLVLRDEFVARQD